MAAFRSARDRCTRAGDSFKVRAVALLLASALTVGAVATRAAYSIVETDGSGARITQRAPAPGEAVRVADSDAWTESLRTGAYWKQRNSKPERRPPLQKSPAARAVPSRHVLSSTIHSFPSSKRSGTYRSVCVRLCDGFFWPISFATTRHNLKRDSEACRESCAAPAALYYYRNPGGEPEDMISLDGEPYTGLSTAFLYRIKYEPACKCRPHPWEPEAIARHEDYARSSAVDDASAPSQE